MKKDTPNPILTVRKNCLLFDGMSIHEFAESRETPFYLFSERALDNNYETLQKAFCKYKGNKLTIAYSMKNNSLPLILDVIARKEGWFEVSSLGEMQLLGKLGIPLSRCVYTSIWKSPKTIRYAMKNKLGLFAVDSPSDMKNISSVAGEMRKKAKVLLRVNPVVDVEDAVFASSVSWSKIGTGIIYERDNGRNGNDALALVQACLEDGNLSLCGLHGHLGSQIVNLAHYDEFARKMCDFYIHVEEKYGMALEMMDFGGGYPADYGQKSLPPVSDIADTILSQLESAGIGAHIVVESGRYVTAGAGVLVTRIVSIKQSHYMGKIVITDASSYNELLDSVLVHWYFDMEVANKAHLPKDEKVSVVGPTTDSIDVFDPPVEKSCKRCEAIVEGRRERLLQRTEEGDILAILGAGAYTTCFNMNYCLLPRPAIYIIRKNGRIVKARRREDIDDMLSCSVMPKRRE